MKSIISISAAIILSVFTLFITSCNGDDDVTPSPKVTLTEVGLENSKKGMAGGDFHIEGEITAEGRIAGIKVAIVDAKSGAEVFAKTYSDSKYVGVKNAEFHEHIEIPADLAAGNYRLLLIVTDALGGSTTVSENITVTVAVEGAPVVTLTKVGTDNSLRAVAGKEMPVAAVVKAQHKIAEIEVELHEVGTEYEKVFTFGSGYTGMTEADFAESILIPSDAAEGEYHLHFTVTDANGNATTAECEGLMISGK